MVKLGIHLLFFFLYLYRCELFLLCQLIVWILLLVVLQLLLHQFNRLFSKTSWVIWCEIGKTSLNLSEAGVGWQRHQLDHMQTVCTSLHTDDHANTLSLHFCRLDALPDAQPPSQSTVGTSTNNNNITIIFVNFLSWPWPLKEYTWFVSWMQSEKKRCSRSLLQGSSSTYAVRVFKAGIQLMLIGCS